MIKECNKNRMVFIFIYFYFHRKLFIRHLIILFYYSFVFVLIWVYLHLLTIKSQGHTIAEDCQSDFTTEVSPVSVSSSFRAFSDTKPKKSDDLTVWMVKGQERAQLAKTNDELQALLRLVSFL